MSKQIADFLIELSKSPLLAEQFKKDRLQAIAAAGFTGQDAELLRISDPGQWERNFPEMRLGGEPDAEAFEAEFDVTDVTISEPPAEVKKPPRGRTKAKARSAAKKTTKKPAPKMAKRTAKKKGGRK
jgi:hypothetical protein